MRKRFRAGGQSLGIAIAGILMLGATFAGLWFFGNWLWTTSVWWIGIFVRIVQWGIGAMLVGFTIYWGYMFIKGLATGESLED